MTQVTHQQLATALVEELGAAIEAGLGEAVAVSSGAVEAGQAWMSTVTAGGALTGQIELAVSALGARAIASKLLGMDEEPEPSVLSDMLKEMWAQAIATVSAKPEFAGVTLTAQAPQSATHAGGRGWVLSADADVLAQVLVVGALAAGIAAPRVPASSAPATRSAQRDPLTTRTSRC